MSSDERLRELLPSLYRPEPDAESLLNRLLGATGQLFDVATDQLQHVLRAHWLDTADSALWDTHYQTARRERGLPAANVRVPKDLAELRQYPYIADLARLCALLNLPPWLEPAGLREALEEYRQRVGDLLDAYRLGLTTVPALRRLVEAALPEDMTATPAQQRWPFAIEEPRALRSKRLKVVVPAAQEGDLLSPLYRWVLGDALGPPTVYLQGVTPNGELVAATEQPAVECCTPGQTPAGVALGYRGTLAPGQTLRLSPARRSWLTLDGVLQASTAETGANAAQDSSANGPWQAVTGLPSGELRLLVETLDGSLWMVLEAAGSWSLQRYDGSAFAAVTQGAPAGPFLSLQARADALYLGTQQGLFRCALFPAEGQTHALSAVAAVPEPVHALGLLADGHLACAGDDGLALVDAGDQVDSRALPGTALRALHVDQDRIYLATTQALLLLDRQRWFCYRGEALSEDRPDWAPLAPAAAAAASSPLPPVHRLATTPDGSLWLGTAGGLARYYARAAQTTLLEAFPDLGTGAGAALQVDDRGMLWITGTDGLCRYDGRDLAQYDFGGQRWLGLGRADTQYLDETTVRPRGHWRFAADQDRWERFDEAQRRFTATTLAGRTVAGPALQAILFTDSLRASFGQFDGTDFSDPQPVALDQFVLHIKPDETRIVAGGLPALPRGGGLWRYLQLEPAGQVPPAGRPWWSREGRLFPPPEAPAPWPGHFRDEASPWHADGHFDEAVFAYPPSARLWLDYPVAPAIGVRIRLFRRAPDQAVDPALVERVWQLLARAKAAGVPLELAVEGTVVKRS